MEQQIKHSWILKHKMKFVKMGWANGIGPKSGWITKVFRKILILTIHKPHSEYRDAGIVHDVLYVIGGTEKDRLSADNIFFSIMFNILLSKILSWSMAKEISYFFIALGYYSAVRAQGEKHFTKREKKLSKKEVIKLMNR